MWKPKIIVITGSSGKTTLLHLVESQLGNIARYSHNANSSFGIPFDILGLKRQKLTIDEWAYLFIIAPIRAFKKTPSEKFYVVEADCDRPYEGKFLASFLKPDFTLLINIDLTHSANFDYLVRNKKYSNVLEAIAHEFGYFLEYTKKLAIVNGDSSLVSEEIKRNSLHIEQVNERSLIGYKLFKDRTEFVIDDIKYSINYVVPRDIFYSIKMTNLLTKALDISFDKSFSKFTPPNGRSTILKGIQKTTIIDSTYNATPYAFSSILELFDKYPSEKKWAILGDMIELGEKEQEEHEKIAETINKMNLQKIILIGPRVSRYTYPKIKNKEKCQKFLMPKEGLNYILENIKGEETMLFKGARFLEGIVERLLANKEDVEKLVRREKAWQNRRKSFGL